MTAPMLELREVRKYFPVGTGSFLQRKTAWVKAVEGISFAIAAGRDARADRGVGLRQDHHLQADPAAGAADGGHDPLRWPRTLLRSKGRR